MLIKSVIAKDETSCWIAPPGRGKSTLLTDISVHLATASDRRGYRTRERPGVVYLGLEPAPARERGARRVNPAFCAAIPTRGSEAR
jgi:RecA-family ATPase